MNKPNVVTVEIGGESKRILLCMWGLTLAEEQGFDLAKLDLDEEGASKRKGQLRQMLEMLWIGMLPFEETLTLKDLGMQVGFGDLPAVTAAFEKVVSRQLSDDVRNEVNRVKNKKKVTRKMSTSVT